MQLRISLFVLMALAISGAGARAESMRAEVSNVDHSAHAKALTAIYTLREKATGIYTPAELGLAIAKFRHWIASPNSGALSDAEAALLQNRKDVFENRAALDERVESVDLQRQLIAAGMLDAKVGEAQTRAIRQAIQTFRKSAKTGGLGDLTGVETAELSRLEAVINAFAGFELVADKATGRNVLLPKALVGAQPVDGINSSAWTTYSSQDDTIRVHLFRHSSRANTPVSMAGRLIEKKRDLNFDFLDMTSDDFRIESSARSRRGRYLNYSTAWERNGRLSGLGVSFAYDPLPPVAPPLLPEVEREIETGAIELPSAADTVETPGIKNWKRVAKVLWNLMVSSFDSSNGWERTSAGDCRSEPGVGGKSIAIVYATNRKRHTAPATSEGQSQIFDQLYTSERDDRLHLGCAVVWVPNAAINVADLRPLVAGSTAGAKANDPAARTSNIVPALKFTVSERELAKPRDPFEERDVILVDPLKSRAEKALLFIHGYNNTFSDSLLRIAQIAASVDYQGRVYLFSWPSQESRWSYVGDMDYAEQAELDLQYFMKMILRDAEGLKLDILAHSMGSQILLRSIDNIRPAFERRIGGGARNRVEIGKVIFAAPDVSELVFKRKIGSLSRVAAEKITLYASGNDGALDVSKWLRGKVARAGGLSDGKPINPGTDKVEVIDITGESLPWYYVDRYFGAYHSAFAFEKPVLEDIQTLLGNRKFGTPSERAAQIGKPARFKEETYSSDATKGKYWKLVPEPATAKASP